MQADPELQTSTVYNLQQLYADGFLNPQLPKTLSIF
jgi:hypothetical protein